jgi:hypothetical protein|tara:strand:- start:3827 stop:4108 length:282 start_codon:yes stop_codon:yes gene_type:complete
MVDTRPKVLSLAFAMLATASVLLISNEGTVSANAWALLALSGVFAAAAVMGFFQADETENIESTKQIDIQDAVNTDAQTLPDPSESGFDIPVI